ncbi:MAG TPA: TnsD family transposase [Syntrophomonadaceae bacterium]|nr:TnsD family transposase [Syntrophomonadaceae bacterium]
MVLAHFPIPYDEEILYSVLARYRIRNGSIGIKQVNQELFGSTNVTATVDLPSHIDALVENLPYGSALTADRIINKHTLYTLYKPFLPAKQAEAVFRLMRGSQGGGIHYRVGIMASAVPTPRYLRYCSLCLIEQRKAFGEGFWHRLHQVPGMLVCAKHMLPLSNSSVLVPGLNKHQYRAPDEDCCMLIPRGVSLKANTLEMLAQLSQDVDWVLRANIGPLEPGRYEQHYLAYLIERGLATATGRVYQKDLGRSFIGFYGHDLLKTLHSDINLHSDTHWLANIVRKHRKSFHPIRHLLIMRFLSGSPEKFFSNFNVYLPFGEGPWLCLNAAANHYLKPVVKNLIVTHCADTKRPVGTFSCDCGFVYSRRGPDKMEEDKYKIGRIKSFGLVWQDKLSSLLAIENLSLREMGRILNVDTNTIKKYAKITTSDFNSSWRKEGEKVSTDICTDAKVIGKSNTGESEQPEIIRKGQKSKVPRIDWKERDKQILLEVKKIVKEMLLSQNKPKQITIGGIGKRLGLKSLLDKKLDKLPLTKAYLHKVKETAEDFQKRRVKWAVKELYSKGETLAIWKIKRLAGLQDVISSEIEQIIYDQASIFDPNSLVNLLREINENKE